MSYKNFTLEAMMNEQRLLPVISWSDKDNYLYMNKRVNYDYQLLNPDPQNQSPNTEFIDLMENSNENHVRPIFYLSCKTFESDDSNHPSAINMSVEMEWIDTSTEIFVDAPEWYSEYRNK